MFELVYDSRVVYNNGAMRESVLGLVFLSHLDDGDLHGSIRSTAELSCQRCGQLGRSLVHGAHRRPYGSRARQREHLEAPAVSACLRRGECGYERAPVCGERY